MSKNDDISASERQLFILMLLSQSKRGYTAKEIQKQLEKNEISCSPRTLKRDLDAITMQFNVYEEEIDKQTYYIADKMAIKDITFTIPQMISLYYLKEMLKNAEHTDITRAADGIIDALLSKMPALSREEMKNISSMLKIESESFAPSVVDPAVNETIQNAIKLQRSVDIIYETFKSGEVNRRMVDPYILEIREGKLHAIGFCHLRNGIRDFRLSRIKQAKLTDKSFDTPGDFFNDYQRNRFDKLAGSEIYDVEIEFSGDAAKLVAEYHSGKADKIIIDGNKTIFKRRAAITQDFIQWIVSFGGGAKIISPVILAKQICDVADSIKARYDTN